MKLPIQKLEGNKIILKTFTAEDVTPEYVGWLNDPMVVRFSNQRFNRHTIETGRAYLASFTSTENLFLKIISRANTKIIGTMRANIASPHQTADIGIMIGCREVWGKGFGLDAWSTLMSWFLTRGGIRKVTGGTMRANVAMVKIMEKSGMALEAVRPGQELLEERPQDLMYFGKFREAL